jgi:hypothetical protein
VFRVILTTNFVIPTKNFVWSLLKIRKRVFFDVKTELLCTAVQAAETRRASKKPLFFEKISLCSKRVKNSFIDKVVNKY